MSLRLGIRLQPTPAPSGQITSSSLSYLGLFTLDNCGDLFTEITAMTGRVVAGVTHLFMANAGTGSFYGAFSPVEVVDPGVYTDDYTTATDATVANNWGLSSGVKYDPYHGKFGLTYSTPEFDPFGSPGDPYYISNAFIAGFGWSEADQLLYVSYSSPYGNINPEWNLLAIELTTPGTGGPNSETGLATTAYGVWRNQTGTATYLGYPRFGAQRAYYFSDTAPDGKMLHGSSNGFTAQGQSNQGPSLWGNDYPTRTTPSGYGTSTGGSGERSTDIVGTQDYLSHYGMFGLLNNDGTLPGGQALESARRPGFAGGPNGGDAYIWENNAPGVIPSSSDPPPALDPAKNSHNGSWTTSDSIIGGEWVDTGTASGVLFTGSVTVSHNWYRTKATKTALLNGVTPVTYDRNVDERNWATVFGPSGNNDIYYAAVASNTHVTVAYVDPSAINQSLSITVSSPAITVHLATNGSGVITTTANALLTLWAATGAATALATATLFTSAYSNDGTGLLPAMAAELVAGGPAWCPYHNVDSGIVVTGPCSAQQEAVMLFYATADLIAVRDSGGAIPDYTPDPVDFAFVTDISGASAIQLAGLGPRQNSFTATYYEPISKKLYCLAVDVDLTHGSNNPLPVVHVFQVA